MFVTSKEYEREVKRVLEKEGDACVAVAFWGRDSELFIKSRKGRVRVICNLESGATNPETIKIMLQKMSANVEVKTHRRLHAKVVLNAGIALIGSANMSANGLSHEGEELKGWEEAGLITSAPREINRVQEWFEAQWEDAEKIRDVDIATAITRWKKRRAQREMAHEQSNTRSFNLGLLSAADFADRAAQVVICKCTASDECEQAVNKKLATTTYSSFGTDRMWYYENWPQIPKGTELVDLYWGPRSVSCNGVSQRRLDFQFRYPKKSDGLGHVILTERQSTLLGLKFDQKARREFARVVKPHIEEIWKSKEAIGDDDGRQIPLAEVARICRRIGSS